MHDDVTLPFDDRRREAGEETGTSTQWGSFRLIERVGRGGFGEVYRAWDPNLEREVALKLLLPSGSGEAQSEEEYKAMLREARALASVRHANIVPVYGIDRHEGRVGFWTDFVKGKTLSVLVGAQGPFGDREATLIGLDVTRALSAVHRAGILHRDIKAENVMREEGGRILLMDFGLSALPVGQINLAGTPNYMAPELWQDEPASVESDIYAMGVLLYFLVTGQYPAKIGSLETRDVTEAIKQRRPLMDLRSDLPELFLRTVSRAMESDPAKRFSSAGSLAAALAECLGTPAPVPVEAPPSTAKKSIKQMWLIAVAGAALVLGTVAVKAPAIRQWLHLGGEPAAVGHSSNTNEQYVKAQELLKKSYKDSNVAEAVTIFRQMVKENPDFTLAKAALGSAYFTQYRNNHDPKLLDLAKSATDEALVKQPDLAPALATRARMNAMAGETQLALQYALKAVEQDSRSPEAYNALAEVYDALGNKTKAIDAIQKAIDLDDKNSMPLVKLGNYYMVAGDLARAAEQWQHAIQIDPQNVFAEFDLGIVNMRLDKLAEARGNFQRVLQLQPDAESYLALGTVYLLEGKYLDAIEVNKKAIALDAANQQAWADLGSAYIWSGGNREKAAMAYRKAIELGETQRQKTPEDAQLLADLANYYASVGDAEKSLPLARKALVLSPTDPYILYTTGDTYELLQQRSSAITLLAKALSQGFRVNEFERNPELASLRNDPAYEPAIRKAIEAAKVDSKKKMN